MVTEELIGVIRRKYQDGLGKDQIKESLLDVGWEEVDIDRAIELIHRDALKQIPGLASWYNMLDKLDAKATKLTPQMNALILIACGVVVVLLFFGLYYILDPLGSKISERDKQRETDLIQLQRSIDNYAAATGSYPPTLQALIPTYIEAIPQDPKTGAAYNYKSSVVNYELCVTFEAQSAQCISASADTSNVPVIIVTPTEMIFEEPVPTDDSSLPTDAADQEEPIVEDNPQDENAL